MLSIAELPDGTRTPEELAAEHQGWDRRIVEVRGSATFYERTPAEEHVRQLGLLATEIRGSNPLEALEALKRQRVLAHLIKADLGQPVEWWLRLPKYLHSANKPLEALAELERLIDGCSAWANEEYSHQDDECREGLSCARLDNIYRFLGLVLADIGEKERAREASQKANACRRKHNAWLRRENIKRAARVLTR